MPGLVDFMSRSENRNKLRQQAGAGEEDVSRYVISTLDRRAGRQ